MRDVAGPVRRVAATRDDARRVPRDWLLPELRLMRLSDVAVGDLWAEVLGEHECDGCCGWPPRRHDQWGTAGVPARPLEPTPLSALSVRLGIPRMFDEDRYAHADQRRRPHPDGPRGGRARLAGWEGGAQTAGWARDAP